MNRQLCAGVAVLLMAAGLGAAEPAKRPNVLILTTDQQRVDAMSAAGNRWAKTPNMDALAAQGVYFRSSYCAFPLCSPSRSALHTGRTPHEIRVDQNGVSIDPAVPLSGQLFRAAGYDTAYAGKWHMPESYPQDGIAGFEVLNKTTRTGRIAHDVDEATMEAAIGFLKRKHDKPFLLVASFINPHDICLLAGEKSGLSDELWKRYGPPEGAELPPLPPNFAPKDGGTEVRRGHDDWDEAQWRRYRYAYGRLVEDVDAQLGKVMAALREAGAEESTLVIFTSDHGEGLGSRRMTGKMMFYDDQAAVPLIVSWKGVTPAARMDDRHLVSTLDVLPTICDYAGITPPPAIRGESLRGVIEHPDQAGHPFVVTEMSLGGPATDGRSWMLRTPQYKYMTFPGKPAVEKLFDLKADPSELRNLAGEAAFAAEVARHRDLLAQWKKTTEEEKYPVSRQEKSGRGKKAAGKAGGGAQDKAAKRAAKKAGGVQ